MTTFYIIEKADLDGVQAIVLANGLHSPLEQKNELERRLRSDGVRGRVLFDLFLSFGTKGRRYFISNFDGESLTPLERATDVPCSYGTQSAEMLRRHHEELDLSLLSAASAFAVRKGYVIPA
jgi:hypothetical protein